MTPEPDDDRVERRENLAFEAGRRKAIVDGRLDSAEAKLDALNKSIEKHARNAEALRAAIDQLDDKVSAVMTQLATQAAVEADRVAQFKKANEKQISTRMFVIGVVAIMATIVAAFISSGHFG